MAGLPSWEWPPACESLLLAVELCPASQCAAAAACSKIDYINVFFQKDVVHALAVAVIVCFFVAHVIWLAERGQYGKVLQELMLVSCYPSTSLTVLLCLPPLQPVHQVLLKEQFR
jgi:hypothetical protein